MNLTVSKSDTWGMLCGALCMIHCFATPFLIAALAGSASAGEEAPLWWLLMHYLFLVVSFFAVLRSVQTTSRAFMKPLFWMSWIALAFAIVNEQFGWLELPEIITYATATVLVGLHLYNRRYCQCKTDNCCIHDE